MQTGFAFALAGAACVMLYIAHGNTTAVAKAVLTASRKSHAHQMLGLLVLVAHASEIGKVVSHFHVWHGVAALFLFAIWLATRSSSEEIA